MFAAVPVVWLTVLTHPQSKQSAETGVMNLLDIVTLAAAVAALSKAMLMRISDLAGALSLHMVLLASGLAMTVVSVCVESRRGAPIMPMEVSTNRVVAMSAVAIPLASFGLHGSVCFLPPFAQIVPWVSVADSAGLPLPVLLGPVIGDILSGQLQPRTGSRYRLQSVGSAAIMLEGLRKNPMALSSRKRRKPCLPTSPELAWMARP